MAMGPKRGAKTLVLAGACAAATALATPAQADFGTETDGDLFRATVSYPTLSAYGERARISGFVSLSGWTVTLNLRAAGETRYHPARSARTRRSGTWAIRTGRLVRSTRFKLVYRRGAQRVTGRSHLIGVQALVLTRDARYLPDGRLSFRIEVSPVQPPGAQVRVTGVSATDGARTTLATLPLERSRALSTATAFVDGPVAYSSLEAQFLGSATNRSASTFFTPPPPA